jgi:phosphatidylglycerophosphatase A
MIDRSSRGQIEGVVCRLSEPTRYTHGAPMNPSIPSEHKNKTRAAIRPLNVPTLGLSVFGLGFLRPAPGTWGSAPPCGIAALLVLGGAGIPALHVTVALLLLASSAACVIWGRYAETRFGRKDAPEVVADETAGVCLPLLPAISIDGADWMVIGQIAFAFVLFRVFDILKPWPARQLEALPHGWGVLVDDLIAGLYALIAFNLTVLALATTGVV